MQPFRIRGERRWSRRTITKVEFTGHQVQGSSAGRFDGAGSSCGGWTTRRWESGMIIDIIETAVSRTAHHLTLPEDSLRSEKGQLCAVTHTDWSTQGLRAIRAYGLLRGTCRQFNKWEMLPGNYFIGNGHQRTSPVDVPVEGRKTRDLQTAGKYYVCGVEDLDGQIGRKTRGSWWRYPARIPIVTDHRVFCSVSADHYVATDVETYLDANAWRLELIHDAGTYRGPLPFAASMVPRAWNGSWNI